MQFSLFSRSIVIDIKAILVFLGVVAALWLVVSLRTLALAFFLSLILMCALNPTVTKLSRRIPRTLSVILVNILVLLVILGLLAMLVPPLVIETANLLNWIGSSEWAQSASYSQMMQQQNLPTSIEELPFTLSELSALLASLQTPFASVFSFATSAFGSIILFISLFAMTFYLLLDRPVLAQKARWFTNDRKKIARFDEFLDYWEHQVGGWVRGELLLMLIIGLVTYIVLAIFQVPYALPLAILAGLLEIVPNVGPVIAAIPAVIIAYVAHGPMTGSIVLIATIVIQQLENNLIVPRIMKATAKVNPLVVLLAILGGAQLFGILGALLAVPLYLSIRACYSFYILKRM